MVTLPNNVLSKIAAASDPRTQMRLRATSKALYADPLGATKTLRQGYAYGTGTLQKDYNELPKKLRRLSAQLGVGSSRSRSWKISDALYQLQHVRSFVEEVLKAYKRAVRSDQSHATVTHSQLAERVMAGKYRSSTGFTMSVPREEMVTTTLRYAKKVMQSPEMQQARKAARFVKNKIHFFIQKMKISWPNRALTEDEREQSRARRIARRAARRMQ